MSGSGADGNPDFGAYGAPAGWAPDSTEGDIFGGPTPEAAVVLQSIFNMLQGFLPGWAVQPNGRVVGPAHATTGRVPTLGWVSPQHMGVPGQAYSFDPTSGYVYGSNSPGGPIGALNTIGLSAADRQAMVNMMVDSSVEDATITVNGESVHVIVMRPNLTIPGINTSTCQCPAGTTWLSVAPAGSGYPPIDLGQGEGGGNGGPG